VRTVGAKPSANRTPGWRVAVVATALVCVTLMCVTMVAGCSGSGSVSKPGDKPKDPGQSASPGDRLSGDPSPSACSPWAGLDALSNITTWLRQMIGDEVIFGATTEQAKQDGLAVVVYAESLDGPSAELPQQYARDLRDSVLSVAASPYKKTPEQLNTAANDAQRLAAQISKLCF
jgi:hypothetical protein